MAVRYDGVLMAERIEGSTYIRYRLSPCCRTLDRVNEAGGFEVDGNGHIYLKTYGGKEWLIHHCPWCGAAVLDPKEARTT